MILMDTKTTLSETEEGEIVDDSGTFDSEEDAGNKRNIEEVTNGLAALSGPGQPSPESQGTEDSLKDRRLSTGSREGDSAMEISSREKAGHSEKDRKHREERRHRHSSKHSHSHRRHHDRDRSHHGHHGRHEYSRKNGVEEGDKYRKIFLLTMKFITAHPLVAILLITVNDGTVRVKEARNLAVDTIVIVITDMDREKL
ncbi:hypothetical protein C2G38_1144623 [Gigaspora rosea]|uniref:Uncharacterized protein n=1 Tax=Gigaspora rosea TaxID=44941 RepID=A0A397VP18_9GLOM|nr:hypothetical protein C2G38_1144623 [Gigaspora rosea]